MAKLLGYFISNEVERRKNEAYYQAMHQYTMQSYLKNSEVTKVAKTTVSPQDTSAQKK